MLVLFFNWFTTTCVYYGLTFSVTEQYGELSGSTFIISGLASVYLKRRAANVLKFSDNLKLV